MIVTRRVHVALQVVAADADPSTLLKRRHIIILLPPVKQNVHMVSLRRSNMLQKKAARLCIRASYSLRVIIPAPHIQRDYVRIFRDRSCSNSALSPRDSLRMFKRGDVGDDDGSGSSTSDMPPPFGR